MLSFSCGTFDTSTANVEALQTGARIFSTFATGAGAVWIITEAVYLDGEDCAFNAECHAMGYVDGVRRSTWIGTPGEY